MSINQLDRETPGIFQIWEHDIEEVHQNPAAIHDVGACEPEQLAETTFADYAAVGREILWLYDEGKYSRSGDNEHDGDSSCLLTLDLRGSLRPNIG